MRWGCSLKPVAGCVMALLAAVPAAEAGGLVQLKVQTEARSTVVSKNRLERFLAENGCQAELVFDQGAPSHLSFSRGQGVGQPLLLAVNRESTAPTPVWVTRATAGVRALAELRGRDVSVVAGSDPIGSRLALAALAEKGVEPDPGQRYETADYSSALGLLLHNNTHASVSELGFVRPFLASQGLVITWQGQPVEGAGWYAGRLHTKANTDTDRCLTALANLEREDDRQTFQIFPEWVYRFVAPQSK